MSSKPEKKQCVGRVCGPKLESPNKAARYTDAQCDRFCAEGSNLCKVCTKREDAYMAGETTGTYHGRKGGPIPPYSHIRGSEWNIQTRVKEAERAARLAAAATAGPGVPKAAKSAAKVAKSAASEAASASIIVVAAARSENDALARAEVLLGKAATAAKKGASAEKTVAAATVTATEAAVKAVKQVRKATEKRPKTEKRPTIRPSAARRKTNSRPAVRIPEGYEPLASNSSLTNRSYFAANRSSNSRSSSTRRRNARGRFLSPMPPGRATIKRVPSPVKNAAAAANANVYSSNFESLSSNSAKSVKSNAGLGPAKLGSSNFASSSSNSSAVPNLD